MKSSLQVQLLGLFVTPVATPQPEEDELQNYYLKCLENVVQLLDS